MGLFKQPKPRRFHHEYMFVDERKERLKDIETRAKRELGLADGEVSHHERIRGTFRNATRHVHNRHEHFTSGFLMLCVGALIIMLLALLMM